MEKNRSIINILDLSIEEINELMALADKIEAKPEDYWERCKHKKLATLFFEPSTRTRLSFEAAMLELGGSVLGFAGASSSSAAKGESVADTIETVSNYADIITMRHPKEGAPVVAADHTTVPFINAGDGGHFHPTQTLAPFSSNTFTQSITDPPVEMRSSTTTTGSPGFSFPSIWFCLP